jgi:uncharacterized protein (UPF0261 family)
VPSRKPHFGSAGFPPGTSLIDIAMTAAPRILLIGTADTKAAELEFLQLAIARAGGTVLFMDVGVGRSHKPAATVSNADVAAAAGTTIETIAGSGDENLAMTKMAEGASEMTRRLYAEGRIDGLLALGGTMGTDLALDVASVLPLGVPKFVVSTIAYSHLIPPERIPPDLMMILWAGGLYGLNEICRSSLAQAAGAVVGACRAAMPPRMARPLVGMTSLGKSCLRYMETLLPALQSRGYDVAVFHTTGMGGRAFEALAAEGRFVAVMDFSLQELANHLSGSVVTAGANRLEGAGLRGVPQIVAPGAIDMIDFPTWRPGAMVQEDRAYHAHNRLLASVTMGADERRGVARAIADKLAAATGPTAFILPRAGIQGWDRPGEALYQPDALTAFVEEAQSATRAPVQLVAIDAHINDKTFCETALAIFDRWVSEGLIPAGRP